MRYRARVRALPRQSFALFRVRVPALLLCLLALLPWPVPGWAQGAAEHFARKAAELSSLRASFVQEIRPAGQTPVIRCAGVLFFERPDKLRFEHWTPLRAGLLSVAGRTQRLPAEPGDDEVRDQHPDLVAKALADELLALLRFDLAALRRRFVLTELAASPLTLALVPRQGSEHSYLARLVLEASAVHPALESITLEGGQGDRVILRFFDHKANVPLPEGTFKP